MYPLRRLFCSNVISLRQFHQTRPLLLDPTKVEEVKIPVPWGHIAGRWWGDQTETPVLALHGLKENSAAFNNLAPLLQVPSLLCIDLPGHGQSSHLDPGLSLHFLDNIIYLRYLIKNHFKWDSQVQILGHSFGACLGLIYSGLFPVKNFVSIDTAIYYMSQDPKRTPVDLKRSIDTQLDIEKVTPTGKSFDELLAWMVENQAKTYPVSEEGCRIILSRGVTKLKDSAYTLSIDPRLEAPFFGRITGSFIKALSASVKCRVLVISARDGGVIVDRVKDLFEDSIASLKSNASYFEHFQLDGGHHIHLEQPQVHSIAPLINSFLNSP